MDVPSPPLPLHRRAWPRRLAISLLLLAAVGYAGIATTLAVFQDQLIFAGRPGLSATPAASGLAFEEVLLDVQGEKTHGWYLPVPGARGALLFSHGNGGNVSGWHRVAPFYHGLGLGILVYDYGGYGNSTGAPSEPRCHADARAMWDWLTQTRGVPANKIVLVGRSLGGGPTLELAQHVRPAGVVIEGTFLSMPAQASEMFPWLPVRGILRTEFNNVDKIGKIGVPVLIFHSREDELIPFSHGEGLFAASQEPKRLVPIHGDHNNCFRESGEITGPAWAAFADEVLGKTPLP